MILSDILQSGRNEESLYREVAELLKVKGIDRMIGIGDAISRQQDLFDIPKQFFASTDNFATTCCDNSLHAFSVELVDHHALER